MTPVWRVISPADKVSIVVDPGPRTAGGGAPYDQELARLQADLFAARAAVEAARCGPHREPRRARAAETDLLACLETYAQALALRRLPVPRRIRNELRLRRLLKPESP